MRKIEKDEADIIFEIPANFEKNLVKESETNLLLSVNAVNGTKANIRYWYLMLVPDEHYKKSWCPILSKSCAWWL